MLRVFTEPRVPRPTTPSHEAVKSLMEKQGDHRLRGEREPTVQEDRVTWAVQGQGHCVFEVSAVPEAELGLLYSLLR